MNCNEFRKKIDAYIDGRQTDDLVTLKRHLEQCDACTALYEDLRWIRLEMSTLHDLPEGFREELHQRLLNEAQNVRVQPAERTAKTQRSKRNLWIWTSVAAIFVLLVLGPSILAWLPNHGSNTMAGIARENSDVPNFLSPNFEGFDGATSNDVMMIEPADPSTKSGGSVRTSDTVRKIIYSYQLRVEMVDLKDKIQSIETLVASAGGFFEESSFFPYQRKAGSKDLHEASIVLRVPVAHTPQVLQSIRDMGKIRSEQKHSTDITMVYSDLESEIRNLKAAEERYLALYSKAELIEDMLRIESEITRLRGQIDILEGRRKNYDNQVELTTIQLYLTEVESHDVVISGEPDVWSRAWNGLLHTVNAMITWAQNSLIWIVTILPVLLVILAVIGIVTLVVRTKKRRKGVQHENKQ
ncbi:MAG: DUF4349 domain-containing protein [Bacillota bacterium]|nr:DUF4349 domain-containing protein [Bacillota bacterium]